MRAATAPKRSEASAWRRRVFRNTFTRDGQLQQVKRWSVKIQFQGVRRTLALRAATRDEAAAEAEAVYATLLTEGWEAALRAHARPLGSQEARATPPAAAAGTDRRQWKQRLLRRRYTSQSEEFSVRIEHAGRSHYFPLATADEATACARAAQIHRSVLRDGWEEACHRFPRELTVGFHWSADPLAWTYATIHTRPLANAWMTTPPARGAASGAVEPIAADIGPAPENRKAPLIAVVESERGLGQALEWHLGGLAASVRLLANGAEALREVPRQHFHLALVNHTLPDASGAECAEQLGHLAPRTPVLIYSAHEDSEQLFKSTPGGAFGYVLKRTAPEHLLAPIEGLFADGTLSAERVGEQVRRYFQTVTASLQAPQRLHEMSRLTPRETQILDCLSKGYLDKEIAGALGISAWTVHGHLKNIFAKLGVHSRIEAVVKYLQK